MVIQKKDQFIYYKEIGVRSKSKINVIVSHLTPESNYEDKILDLELDIWHTDLYDYINEEFMTPMFDVIEIFQKNQLFDWIKYSLDLMRPGKNEDYGPMNAERKKHHDELQLALVNTGV
jgi:hypothetical protein